MRVLCANDDEHGDSYKASLSGERRERRERRNGLRRPARRVLRHAHPPRGRRLRGAPSAVYERWCLREDGEKVSAGTFRTDGSGKADVSLTTAAVPGEYHRLSIERKLFAPSGVEGERVMAGEIEYPHS